jgi:phosphate transport system permease protein
MKSTLVHPDYRVDLPARQRRGLAWRWIFQVATVVGVIALVILLAHVVNGSFGYVALQARIDPQTLAVNGAALEQQSGPQLVELLRQRLSAGAFNKLNSERPFERRSRSDVYRLVVERILRYEVLGAWDLWGSLTRGSELKAATLAEHPDAIFQFRAWLNPDFVTGPQTSEAMTAGIRTALLGTLWTILFTILLAFPVGVGAAIYLEEYAGNRWINRFIQTNINNLAGVPSIVYGMLGLAIFVRALQQFTSGSLFGLVDPTTANGRTVLSAGLTLGVLVLPIIIINAQEAIRAVPASLRSASYGLGATKWQTTWHHVLPGALPGILTGTILAISRAIGETAPLVVVGASSAISFDPASPFSRFTTLPIQIYQWTSRPQDEFRGLAAAAILVLLALLLSLNASAVFLRNRYSRRT